MYVSYIRSYRRVGACGIDNPVLRRITGPTQSNSGSATRCCYWRNSSWSVITFTPGPPLSKQLIIASPAVQHIIAASRVDHIVARVSDERLVLRGSGDGICSAVADDPLNVRVNIVPPLLICPLGG
jgi:hypothetical protein